MAHEMEEYRPGGLTTELYFLIAKFLEAGPCSRASQALKEDLAEQKVIPKRLDWEGNEHEQSFREWEAKLSHIQPNHLLDLCKRIGPLLDKEVKPSVPGVNSLVSRGRLSLLRTAKDVSTFHHRLLDFATRRHHSSPYCPIACCHHNIVQVLQGREISGPLSRRHTIDGHLYSRIHLLNRALGHLSAVYCLLFDRTGKYVITGADDLLVKVWSVIDGRLLYTFRGASSEITDIAINVENTLLAAGSLDRIIRVWCLQTVYPIAVLTAHTGMITGVNFCPNIINDVHYLVSTSTDGSIAFWSFTKDAETNVIFEPKPLQYNEKLRPGQAQMICASFSPGGMFLAAGSGDHHVRVYSMEGESPHRIMETEKHSDRVDSIQWANKGLRFISGSKDGTAIIWCYKAQQWVTIQLLMTTKYPGKKEKDEEGKAKLRVTMVCWNADDSCVITAVNNYSIKVWESSTGKLLQVFTLHKDEVYVLESHPFNPKVLLSAGHDGVVFFWDIFTGEQFSTYQNYIEGQGNGAVFDAKWSPDGSMVSATDSHGHILLFGFAMYCDRMKLVPKELFFHTDYRPLVRDAQHNVLDEQTEIPPHLMPPPFLVDIDGNPYPPDLQRLVPGRQHCTVDQLIPNIVFTAGGQQEVIQGVGETRSNIDQMIQALAVRSVNQENSGSVFRLSIPPRSRHGMRRSGDVEGVRQSSGNWQRDDMNWTQSLLMPPLTHGALKTARSKIEFLGSLEVQEYEREKKRIVEIQQVVSVSQPSGKQKRRHPHNYRTRAAREEEEAQEEAVSQQSSSSENDTSDATAHSEDMSSSTSDSSSSEYSDWIADHGVNLEPPQRVRRKVKRKAPAANAKPQVKKLNLTQPNQPNPPQEIPELYRPSEWLSEVIPKKFPYYPQMGDEVMFFKQGFEQYLRAVNDKKVYEITKSQCKPWGKLNLKEPELVKVIGIKYEIRPPRLCCLRLAVMRQNGRLTGDRFTIRYHDIPDVIDFLVLRQTYDTALARLWQVGDRFRSMIDDGWWWGIIEGRRPNANSPFLCHRIRWDNGEVEDMSPWDMEPVDPAREPEYGGSVPVLPEEIAAILYHPRVDEWPGGDRDLACQRILAGLEDVMGLAIAEPFIAPVDINTYPAYAYIVEYSIDLSTIKARFENRFYRRVTAAQFDMRYLATNAEKFNEPHSAIVKQARIVTDLCLHIIKEESLIDVPSLYRKLLDSYHSSNSEEEDSLEPSTSSRQQAAASRSLRALRRANHKNHQPSDWRKDCWDLLDVLWNCQDSEPFREPVDTLEHPDYEKVIDTPMDLGTIREELRGGNYESPLNFCKDIRMIFTNSRNYNTNKRSRIYVMTVRLSAMAEEHMKRIIQNWKSSTRRQGRQNTYGPSSKRRKRARTVVSYEEKNSESESEKEITHHKNRGKIRQVERVPSTNLGINITYMNGGDSMESTSRGIVRTRRYIKSYCEKNTESSDEEEESSFVKSTRSTRHKQISYMEKNSESEEEIDVMSDRNSDVTRPQRQSHEVSYKESGGDSSSSSSEEQVPFKNWSLNRKGTVRILKPVKRTFNHMPTQKESDDEQRIEEDTLDQEESDDNRLEDEEEGSGNEERGGGEEVEEGDEEEVEGDEEEGDGDGEEDDTNKDEEYKQDSSDDESMNGRDESEQDSEEYSIPCPPRRTSSRKRPKSLSSESTDSYQPGTSRSRVGLHRARRPRRSVKRHMYEDDSESDSKESRHDGRPQRTQRRQYKESVDTSDSSNSETPEFSISSRGRIRKLTPRVRAFLKE